MKSKRKVHLNVCDQNVRMEKKTKRKGMKSTWTQVHTRRTGNLKHNNRVEIEPFNQRAISKVKPL